MNTKWWDATVGDATRVIGRFLISRVWLDSWLGLSIWWALKSSWDGEIFGALWYTGLVLATVLGKFMVRVLADMDDEFRLLQTEHDMRMKGDL